MNVCVYVLYVYMYVCTACMYACMYVCMHACMYVCMYVCMYGVSAPIVDDAGLLPTLPSLDTSSTSFILLSALSSIDSWRMRGRGRESSASTLNLLSAQFVYTVREGFYYVARLYAHTYICLRKDMLSPSFLLSCPLSWVTLPQRTRKHIL